MKNSCFQELLNDWEELEAFGIPLELMKFRTGIDSRHLNGGLTIEQEGGVEGNLIVELENHTHAYLLTAFIRRELPGSTMIMDWGLEVPWEEYLFEWLSDPEEEGHKNRPYSFSGDSALIYERKMILNHHRYRKGVLRRGDVLKGTLLGVGYARIPEMYRDGAKIPVTLQVVDQWDRVHCKDFDLWLMRSVDRPIRNRSKRKSLFSDSDPIHSR